MALTDVRSSRNAPPADAGDDDEAFLMRVKLRGHPLAVNVVRGR